MQLQNPGPTVSLSAALGRWYRLWRWIYLDTQPGLLLGKEPSLGRIVDGLLMEGDATRRTGPDSD